MHRHPRKIQLRVAAGLKGGISEFGVSLISFTRLTRFMILELNLTNPIYAKPYIDWSSGEPDRLLQADHRSVETLSFQRAKHSTLRQGFEPL